MSNKCFTSLERENAQMRAVIEQQKEVIERLALIPSAVDRKRDIEQSALIEKLAEALKGYKQFIIAKGLLFGHGNEALQQYELWKESK
jgi:hypothetical protein